MRIKWIGHACFLITSEGGAKIITDPYMRSPYIKYEEIREKADIVLISHDHDDHNNPAAVMGKPQIVKETGEREVKGIKIKGIPSFHDTEGGRLRGKNIIFCFEVDGMRICHLGDLGHTLSPETVKEIGDVDILLIPVGGTFTIGPEEAEEVVKALKPKIIIPMHYKTEYCLYPLKDVSEFTKGKEAREGGKEIEIKKEDLPEKPTIIVMKP